jgi:tellurite resistance protein
MTEMDEDAILQNLMNTILLVAMDDGEITQDELAILKQVKLDVNGLRQTLKDLEEDSDTKEEAKQLKEFRKNLLQNAYDITRQDRVITQEERNIINSLIKTLMN